MVEKEAGLAFITHDCVNLNKSFRSPYHYKEILTSLTDWVVTKDEYIWESSLFSHIIILSVSHPILL